MEIRQLKYFVCVAETGSFSKASQRCHLTQSAISQQIQSLEACLGCVLFVRSSHRVTLTESGESLLPHARKILREVDECCDHLSGQQSQLQGQLHVGMSHFIEPYVRQAAALMLREHPEVKLRMYYLPTDDLHRMLVNRELDMAFTINTPQMREGIESRPALTFHLVAVMRSTHQLASNEKVTFEQLLPYGTVMPETGTRLYSTLRQYIDVDIDQLNVRAVVNEPLAALNLVQDANLITFLPARSIDGHPSLVAKPIEGLEMPLQSYVHHMKDTPLKRSADVFMRFITDYSVPYCKSMGM